MGSTSAKAVHDRTWLTEALSGWTLEAVQGCYERATAVKARHAELLKQVNAERVARIEASKAVAVTRSETNRKGTSVSHDDSAGQEAEAASALAAELRTRGGEEELGRALAEAADHHCIMLNRREWMEVFTDFTVLTKSGFLSLGLEVFEALDVHKAGRVDFVESVLMCVLCGDGSPHEQMKFAFEMFDVDGSKALNEEEMDALIAKLARAAVVLGLIDGADAPTEDIIKAIGAEMFRSADIDRSGCINEDEWVRWSLSHVMGQRLLRVLERHKNAEQIREAELAAAASKAKYGAYGHQLRQRKVPTAKSKKGEALSQQARENMKVRQARKATLEDLLRISPFDISELKTLLKKFSRHAHEMEEREDRSGSPGPRRLGLGLHRDEFEEFMEANYPKMKDKRQVLDHVFDAFDSDNSGTLDFNELVMGLGQLTRGSLEEKMDLLFQMYDSNGDGQISVHELMVFVNKENASFMESMQFAEELATIVAQSAGVRTTGIASQKGKGALKLSRKAFQTALKEHPVLFDCFASAIVPGMDKVAGPFREHREAFSEFNMEKLQVMWRVSATESNGSREMSLPIFRKFMMEQFGVGHEVLPMVNQLFRVLDDDGGGTLSWHELFVGLSQVMTGTNEERAAFYFDMYDVDGSGEMDHDEILHMLLSSQQAQEKSVETANRVLAVLDEDGDGTVTIDEFIERVQAVPEVLECFRRLFGGAEPGKVKFNRKLSPDEQRKAELDSIIKAAKGGSSDKAAGGAGAEQQISLLRRHSLAGVSRVVGALQAGLSQANVLDAKTPKSSARRGSRFGAALQSQDPTATSTTRRRSRVGEQKEVYHKYTIKMKGKRGRRASAHAVVAREHSSAVIDKLDEDLYAMKRDLLDADHAQRRVDAVADPRLGTMENKERRRSVTMLTGGGDKALQNKMKAALDLGGDDRHDDIPAEMRETIKSEVELEWIEHESDDDANHRRHSGDAGQPEGDARGQPMTMEDFEAMVLEEELAEATKQISREASRTPSRGRKGDSRRRRRSSTSKDATNAEDVDAARSRRFKRKPEIDPRARRRSKSSPDPAAERATRAAALKGKREDAERGRSRGSRRDGRTPPPMDAAPPRRKYLHAKLEHMDLMHAFGRPPPTPNPLGVDLPVSQLKLVERKPLRSPASVGTSDGVVHSPLQSRGTDHSPQRAVFSFAEDGQHPVSADSIGLTGFAPGDELPSQPSLMGKERSRSHTSKRATSEAFPPLSPGQKVADFPVHAMHESAASGDLVVSVRAVVPQPRPQSRHSSRGASRSSRPRTHDAGGGQKGRGTQRTPVWDDDSRRPVQHVDGPGAKAGDSAAFDGPESPGPRTTVSGVSAHFGKLPSVGVGTGHDLWSSAAPDTEQSPFDRDGGDQLAATLPATMADVRRFGSTNLQQIRARTAAAQATRKRRAVQSSKKRPMPRKDRARAVLIAATGGRVRRGGWGSSNVGPNDPRRRMQGRPRTTRAGALGFGLAPTTPDGGLIFDAARMSTPSVRDVGPAARGVVVEYDTIRSRAGTF